MLQGVRDLARGQYKDKDWRRIAAKIQGRAVIAINLRHPCPRYGARTKEMMQNEDAGRLIRQATRARVWALLTEYPGLLERLLAT